jgi:hypothetical protein
MINLINNYEIFSKKSKTYAHIKIKIQKQVNSNKIYIKLNISHF